MSRPRIGITCDFETLTDRRGQPAPRYVSPEGYVRAVEAAGAAPILLPHVPPSRAGDVMAILDGVVVSGGDFDVPPEYYGDDARPALGKLIEDRSLFERTVVESCLERGTPLLGVCGGMQLLNVVAGGTLYQDLSERPDTGVHEQPEDKRRPFHAVRLTAGTILHRLCERDVLDCNSTHHQVVKDLGPGVTASGHAPDGVIEAIELDGHPFALGVQWHPELLDDDAQRAIYRGLVAAIQKP